MSHSFSENERNALTLLAILQDPFGLKMANEFSLDAHDIADGAQFLANVAEQGLFEKHGKLGYEWYTVSDAARRELFAELNDIEIQALHIQAANFYGLPFINQARRMMQQHEDAELDDATLASFARHRDGILGQAVWRSDDTATTVLRQALAWRTHLYEGGLRREAYEIVEAVYEVLSARGDDAQAQDLLRESISSLEGIEQAYAKGNLANLLTLNKNYEEALSLHREVQEVFAKEQNTGMVATALNMQAQCLHQLGRLDEAVTVQEQALEKQPTDSGKAASRHHLSVLEQERGNTWEALRHSSHAESLNMQEGNKLQRAGNLYQQGLIFRDRDELDTALERLGVCEELCHEADDDSGLGLALHLRGQILLQQERYDEAQQALVDTLSLYQRLERKDIGLVLMHFAELSTKLGDDAGAKQHYQEALAAFDRANMIEHAQQAQAMIDQLEHGDTVQ